MVDRQDRRFAERFHVPGCGRPSRFLLEARSAGKLKTSMFRCFFLLRRNAER